MELLKFNTNAATPPQVAAVATFLAKLPEVEHWEIAPETGKQILRVAGHELDPQRVENAAQEAGFQAVLIQVAGINGEDL